jgi:hypothetical protein
MIQLYYNTRYDDPYKFVGAMLAPKGAFYIEYNDTITGKCANLYPVMYIQMWRDPRGRIWDVPLRHGEIQDMVDDGQYGFQEYIQMVINENRRIETCLTCSDFIDLCRRTGRTTRDGICHVMESLYTNIIKGYIGSTPELLGYFKKGTWGNLLTLTNDGTLGEDFDFDELNPDGTIKSQDETEQ